MSAPSSRSMGRTSMWPALEAQSMRLFSSFWLRKRNRCFRKFARTLCRTTGRNCLYGMRTKKFDASRKTLRRRSTVFLIFKLSLCISAELERRCRSSSETRASVEHKRCDFLAKIDYQVWIIISTNGRISIQTSANERARDELYRICKVSVCFKPLIKTSTVSDGRS